MAGKRGESTGTGAITDMKHTPVKPMESDDRMSFNHANRFLSTNGYLFGTQPNTTRLAGEAQKLAAEMDCSFSPDLRRLFISCEDSGEYDACFTIIRFLYRQWHVRMPKTIRAFAAIPEVWKEFLRITAEQVNILLTSDPEGDSFP